MTQGMMWTAVVAAVLCAAPLRAQDSIAPVKHDTGAVAAAPAEPAAGAVKPGMTEADVRAQWGDPIAVRRMNDWTYLFYRNEHERSVGYYDVVFLQSGQVVDAVVRSASHVYDGQSSSPPGRVPAFTPPSGAAADTASGAVTGVRVKPGK